MSKNSNTSPLFKILFFSNIWIYFFCTVQIKDSCIVDIENGRFYLLFLRLIWDCTLLTAAEDVILDFNAFYRWFRAEVTSRKDFLLPFVAFYRWFCACSVSLGANLLLHFLVFGRLCAPVTVEADILSSLIIFYDWFCKRATAEADFLGSCRKYISPENRCLKKVETDRLHCEWISGTSRSLLGGQGREGERWRLLDHMRQILSSTQLCSHPTVISVSIYSHEFSSYFCHIVVTLC